LKWNGWKVILDAIESKRETIKSLNNQGGFAVTQIGQLEKEDGGQFKAVEAQQILRAIGFYVSFACGRWTGPCLPTGFNADGEQVWEFWNFSRMVPFESRLGWLDTNHAEHFEQPFPGFMRLWTDDSWEAIIRVAIHWYLEANAQAGSIEGSIVLTQTAFELIASAVLVENYFWLTTEGYDKLTAADRTRLLLRWAGIPTSIPDDLTNLANLSKANNWPDTATAMTMIRNTITHPTKKNREKYDRHPSAARTEAWMLGLWNLELCLLRLFEYRGSYANRIMRRFSGEVEKVPWTSA
jgi:hypothetical protein